MVFFVDFFGRAGAVVVLGSWNPIVRAVGLLALAFKPAVITFGLKSSNNAAIPHAVWLKPQAHAKPDAKLYRRSKFVLDFLAKVAPNHSVRSKYKASAQVPFVSRANAQQKTVE